MDIDRLPRELHDRLVVVPETGCVRWTGGHTGRGYGEICGPLAGGKSQHVYAHRFVYEWLVEEIPPGYTIDHVAARGCAFRDCVNIEHLEVVTQAENARRGQVRRWALDERVVAEIRAAQGSPQEIAARFGVGIKRVRKLRMVTVHA